jgi:putative transposase
MFLTPLNALSWAYQLHYYLCFSTYRSIPFAQSEQLLLDTIQEICVRHDYHLLNSAIYPEHLRALISLKPAQRISKVVQTLKANSSRLLQVQRLWSRGFLARSVGRMRVSAVRQYLQQQSEHHGYAQRILPPVFRYRAQTPQLLSAAHSVFDLKHHLVFSTSNRCGVFTSGLGAALCDYWLKVAELRRFTLDQVTIVPDHVHLLVRTVPAISIEECALSLLNNGQHFVGKNFGGLLVETGLDNLWQPSAYGGTCGEFSTALVKHWLNSGWCKVGL